MRISTVVVVSLSVIVPCIADVLVVESDGSGQYPTIQAAIDAAYNEDVIEVKPGTYIGEGNRDIHFDGKAITVRSIDPNDPHIVAATIIDCGGTESAPHRGFDFWHNETSHSVLAGLTIRNGYTESSGGAIRCIEASPTIVHCDIIGNTTGPDVHGGAGMWCYGSRSVIIGCRFINNVAQGEGVGGGFRGSSGAPYVALTDCVFIGNSAYRGGAIHNCDGPLNNCVIVRNKARYGGGIHSSDGPITNCVISGNSGEYTGGLDWCNGPISNCVISGNFATSDGGGGLGWCHTTITNCVIAGNFAARWGGGILDSSATIKNCVIVGNRSGDIGGGVAFIGNTQTMEIVNSIIWDNDSANGAQVGGANESNLTLGYCDIEGGATAVYGGTGFTVNWGIGNIDVSPDFVEPGYWDPNDTPGDMSDDFWVNGDYHLQTEGGRWDGVLLLWVADDRTSRCIDAGNPGSTLAYESEIVPGASASLHNIRVDMGAYGGTTEASIAPRDWALQADLTNDGATNLADFAGLAEDWLRSASEQPGDLDRDGDVDGGDIALLAENWLKQTTWARPAIRSPGDAASN
ncbi:MAG: hypothetical protein IH624_12445 [Phycisphaerae bacterium]|nr:hypothetical protein [Phycisphaerae bacterium]